MSREREVAVHHDEPQRATGYLTDEWHRQPRSPQVGRDQQSRRSSARSGRTSLSHRLSPTPDFHRSLSRHRSRHRGHISRLVRKRRPSSRASRGSQARRSREKIANIAQEAQQPNEPPKPDSAGLNTGISKEELKTGSRSFAWTPLDPTQQTVRSVLKGGRARRKRRRDQRKARSRRSQGEM